MSIRLFLCKDFLITHMNTYIDSSPSELESESESDSGSGLPTSISREFCRVSEGPGSSSG